ncbi:MAG: ribulose-phosphate 3-epimerase [Clostridia bacterium]|nr:ribulose-phosphate 3-epimerase [Clostridia bacterium]
MSRGKSISPSLMCCDFLALEKYISVFEKENIEYLHIDVMDGEFVPNFTLGTDFVKQIKKCTQIPLDLHLMINNPETKLDFFDFGKNDIVSIHAEATRHLHLALQKIKNRGAKAFVAINPGTPIYVLEEVVDDIDGVLVMTVNPGFAGQKLVPSTLKKIAKVRKYLDENGKIDAVIEVDGNVSIENAKLMKEVGADIFVGGTSSIFKDNISEGICNLRHAIM